MQFHGHGCSPQKIRTHRSKEFTGQRAAVAKGLELNVCFLSPFAFHSDHKLKTKLKLVESEPLSLPKLDLGGEGRGGEGRGGARGL